MSYYAMLWRALASGALTYEVLLCSDCFMKPLHDFFLCRVLLRAAMACSELVRAVMLWWPATL
eukprot:9474373-Pyramimonas_sp.AAC.1